MNELDKIIKEEHVSNNEYNQHKALQTISNIMYYLGFVLLVISVILFFASISNGKDYLAIGFISCLVSGINALFFGLIGKCLTDIYNKINKINIE